MNVAVRDARADTRPDPVAVFTLRAWARAYLYAACEYDLHEAVDPLWADAVASGLTEQIGIDGVQRILANEFHRVRDQS
jgi:hypothetical protein